ncbi:MAG: hypothetical protein WCP09_02825 [Candidatus Taylorbacteria bacterium]
MLKHTKSEISRNFKLYLPTTPLVIDPKNPVDGRPLSFWYFIRAFLVKEPNEVVSLPGEPGPEVAIV